jgi:putative phosphoesterase
MKVAIFSDSHDNLENLKRAIDWIKKEKIEILIHCGDVASFDTLKFIMDNFPGEVFLSLGNMDKDYSLEKFPKTNKIKIEREFGEIEIKNKKIAFCHSPALAKKLAKGQKYDFIFFGHTHKAWEEKIGKTRIINPGELAGLYYKPTFAVCDFETGKVELKVLEILK